MKVATDLAFDGGDSLILGCTEGGLLLNANNTPLPVFDTTTIHCKTIIEVPFSELHQSLLDVWTPFVSVKRDAVMLQICGYVISGRINCITSASQLRGTRQCLCYLYLQVL